MCPLLDSALLSHLFKTAQSAPFLDAELDHRLSWMKLRRTGLERPIR